MACCRKGVREGVGDNSAAVPAIDREFIMKGAFNDTIVLRDYLWGVSKSRLWSVQASNSLYYF